MNSILQKNSNECFLCGSQIWLECHHIFGASNRKNSEKYGFKVQLCHYCHNEPPYGVHHNAERMEHLHQIGQEAFEKTHTREDFIQIFGKNYL